MFGASNLPSILRISLYYIMSFTTTRRQENDHDQRKGEEGFLAGLGVNDIGERYKEQAAKSKS